MFSLWPAALDPRNWSTLFAADLAESTHLRRTDAVTLLSDERFSASTFERAGFAATDPGDGDDPTPQSAGWDEAHRVFRNPRERTVTREIPDVTVGRDEALNAVECLSLQHRLAASRFAERRRRTSHCPVPAVGGWFTEVTLNPEHVWSRVEPRSPANPDDQVDAAVFLYAVDREVRAVQVTSEVAAVLRRLEASGPQHWWSLQGAFPGWTRHETWRLFRELQQLGIVVLD